MIKVIYLTIKLEHMNNNGLMVSVWGPVGWKYLHSVAHGYPVNPQEFDTKNGFPPGTTENNYKMFFKFVGKTLPCRLCRDSYGIFTGENPIRLQSRQELTRWLWEIHNKVTDKIDHTREHPTFESVSELYESFRANCPNKPDAKGCTEPVDKNTKKRCRITIEPIPVLYMDCHLLKITVILSIIAFLYMRYYY